MTELVNSGYLWPYTISNILGLLFIFIDFKRPRAMRIIFIVLFSGAGIFNAVTAYKTPDAYMMYAGTAVPLYVKFINGWFKEHIQLMVWLIALGQIAIAAGLLLKDRWVKLALTGIIVFLMCIAPLGIGSAFPFSITVSIAAMQVLRQDKLDYIWKRKSINE